MDPDQSEDWDDYRDGPFWVERTCQACHGSGLDRIGADCLTCYGDGTIEVQEPRPNIRTYQP